MCPTNIIILLIQPIYTYIIFLACLILILVTLAMCIVLKSWLFFLLFYCGNYYIPNYSSFTTIFMFYAFIPYIYKEFVIKFNYENDGEFVAWNKLEGNLGDIVEFRRQSYGYTWGYAHWGIYGGERIIHLANLDNGTGVIKFQLLETVANGDLCRVNNLEKLANINNLTKKDEDEIMEIALKRINEKMTYDPIHHNCEHFVTECVYGAPFSSQSEIIHTTWEKELVIKHLYLQSIYMLIISLWRLRYVRDITNRTVFCIISVSQLDSFIDSLESLANWINDNPKYEYTIYFSIALVMYLALELILYLIK